MLETTTPNQVFSKIGNDDFYRPQWKGDPPKPGTPMAALYDAQQRLAQQVDAYRADVAAIRGDAELSREDKATRTYQAGYRLYEHIVRAAHGAVFSTYASVRERAEAIRPAGPVDADAYRAAATRLAALDGPARAGSFLRAARSGDTATMAAAFQDPKGSGFSDLLPDTRSMVLKAYRHKAAPEQVADLDAMNRAAGQTARALASAARAIGGDSWQMKPLVAGLLNNFQKNPHFEP